MTITGSTRLFAIVGAPVAPLRSPALFNAAFAKLGHDAVFVAFEVAQGELPAAWQSYRSAAAPPGAPSPSDWLARERAPSCFTVQRPGADALAAALAAGFPALAVSSGPPSPRGHDIVVNATPMGLHAGDPLPLDPAELVASQIVADVIPNPEITALVAAARALGCATVTGRSMHEGQARLAASYLGIDGWESATS